MFHVQYLVGTPMSSGITLHVASLYTISDPIHPSGSGEFHQCGRCRFVAASAHKPIVIAKVIPIMSTTKAIFGKQLVNTSSRIG